jgi:hypothetical protein
MSLATRHTNRAHVLTNTVTGAAAVTPTDSTDLTEITLSLYIGTAGTLKVTMMDGSVVSYAAITAGRHPLRVKRVWQNGTSATGIVAEY